MKHKSKLIAFFAASLAFIFAAGCTAGGIAGGAAMTIAAAVYPEQAPYPNESDFWGANGIFNDTEYEKVYTAWREGRAAREEFAESAADGLNSFAAAAASELLVDTEGKNAVFSPVNIYMALAMLAEITDGETRAQVLSALGESDTESLRKSASALWSAAYRDDGLVTSVLANSLWLNENVNFVKSTMDTLAESYRASSFKGVPGSEEFDKALQAWLSEQTGGLLDEQAGNVTLDPETLLALASTVYFKAQWSHKFAEEMTDDGVFHAPDGDVDAKFMHSSGTDTYYWSERYSAVGRYLEGFGTMWLILPDEGVSPEQLIEDGSAMAFASADKSALDSKFLVVDLSVPKFDVTSELDIRGALTALGMTDIFDPNVSDFTPMTTDTAGIFISSASHATRVTVDEEGCTAAAFTVMQAAGSAMPPDERVAFTLDRPFIFVITSDEGLPMFAGIVNTPN